jgi:hypothetical protein
MTADEWLMFEREKSLAVRMCTQVQTAAGLVAFGAMKRVRLEPRGWMTIPTAVESASARSVVRDPATTKKAA